MHFVNYRILYKRLSQHTGQSAFVGAEGNSWPPLLYTYSVGQLAACLPSEFSSQIVLTTRQVIFPLNNNSKKRFQSHLHFKVNYVSVLKFVVVESKLIIHINLYFPPRRWKKKSLQIPLLNFYYISAARGKQIICNKTVSRCFN